MDDRIKELNKHGLSCSGMERALSLPQGSMSKWEKDSMKPEEESLLKMIHKFPFLLAVAAGNYKGIMKISIEYKIGEDS